MTVLEGKVSHIQKSGTFFVIALEEMPGQQIAYHELRFIDRKPPKIGEKIRVEALPRERGGRHMTRPGKSDSNCAV